MIKNIEFIEVKDLLCRNFYQASVLLISDCIYSHGAMRQICRWLVENNCKEFTSIGFQHDEWHLICDEVCAFDYNNDDEYFVMTYSYEDLNEENIESWFLMTSLEEALVVVTDMKIVGNIKALITEVRGKD